MRQGSQAIGQMVTASVEVRQGLRGRLVSDLLQQQEVTEKNILALLRHLEAENLGHKAALVLEAAQAASRPLSGRAGGYSAE